MLFDDAEDQVPDHQDVTTYLALLFVLMVAYACAGVDPRDELPKDRSGAPVPEKLGSDSCQYVSVPWDVMYLYHQRAATRVAQVKPDLALQWLIARDQEGRSHWVEIHRNSTLTLGEVVKRSYKEREACWAVLTAAPQQAPEQQQQQQQHQQQRQMAVKLEPGQQAGAPPPRNSVATMTAKGKKICERYNSGGCKLVNNKCKDHNEHVCNFLRAEGVACEGDHPRSACPYRGKSERSR